MSEWVQVVVFAARVCGACAGRVYPSGISPLIHQKRAHVRPWLPAVPTNSDDPGTLPQQPARKEAVGTLRQCGRAHEGVCESSALGAACVGTEDELNAPLLQF